MPGYRIKVETIAIGGNNFVIRSLLDREQFADPLGAAERLGISSAAWPLFGQVWPSARVLAAAMLDFDIAGKRILELGSGLALASLVIHRRHGDITASDHHPLAQAFLIENLRLNDMLPLKYAAGDWSQENAALGVFDLIIGSDVLYDRQQPAILAAFIDRHSAPGVEVVIVDPDRGNRADFCQQMSVRGYLHTSLKAASRQASGERYKGRFLKFRRSDR